MIPSVNGAKPLFALIHIAGGRSAPWPFLFTGQFLVPLPANIWVPDEFQ